MAALQRQYLPVLRRAGRRLVLLAGDAAELDDYGAMSTLEGLLARAGIRASGLLAPSGAFAYALGALDLARSQAAGRGPPGQRRAARTV